MKIPDLENLQLLRVQRFPTKPAGNMRVVRVAHETFGISPRTSALYASEADGRPRDFHKLGPHTRHRIVDALEKLGVITPKLATEYHAAAQAESDQALRCRCARNILAAAESAGIKLTKHQTAVLRTNAKRTSQ